MTWLSYSSYLLLEFLQKLCSRKQQALSMFWATSSQLSAGMCCPTNQVLAESFSNFCMSGTTLSRFAWLWHALSQQNPDLMKSRCTEQNPNVTLFILLFQETCCLIAVFSSHRSCSRKYRTSSQLWATGWQRANPKWIGTHTKDCFPEVAATACQDESSLWKASSPVWPTVYDRSQGRFWMILPIQN